MGAKGIPPGPAGPGSSPRKKNPDIVHPSIPGAVGSRVSRYREGRDLDEEARTLLRDTIERVRGGESGLEGGT